MHANNYSAIDSLGPSEGVRWWSYAK